MEEREEKKQRGFFAVRAPLRHRGKRNFEQLASDISGNPPRLCISNGHVIRRFTRLEDATKSFIPRTSLKGFLLADETTRRSMLVPSYPLLSLR